MKRFLQSHKKGFTLVEVIVSIAILALLAVLIVSVYASSLSIIGNNSSAHRKSKSAAAGIENTLAGFAPDSGISIVNNQEGTFSISFSGLTISADGQYLIGTDNSGEKKYYYFKSN